LADQLTASLSASEKEALWHLNAARIYKITNL
jgi:predicted TIM-barrel fold metal-dependent hydrolase